MAPAKVHVPVTNHEIINVSVVANTRHVNVFAILLLALLFIV